MSSVTTAPWFDPNRAEKAMALCGIGGVLAATRTNVGYLAGGLLLPRSDTVSVFIWRTVAITTSLQGWPVAQARRRFSRPAPARSHCASRGLVRPTWKT